jgi:hypothetical protein
MGGVTLSVEVRIFLSDDIIRMCKKFKIEPQAYMVEKLTEKIHSDAVVWACSRFHSQEQGRIIEVN